MIVATASLPRPPAIADDWALFLDVDGTLLEFAERPDEVRLPPDLVNVLGALHARLDGALALVSGRPLDVLDRLFAPLHLPAAGLHGLERRIDGSKEEAPEPPPALGHLREDAGRVAERYPGAVVEDKGSTLALHWRGNTAAHQDLMALANAALPDLPGYRIQSGDHVAELRPGGADKGSAIEQMMDRPPFAGRRPVFVGDDHTDEHGFEVVRDHDGLAVLVGNRQPSVAAHRLADPADVISWLQAAIGSHA